MPYCKKTADGVLLGLLSDPEELCFPDFEILDDEEVSQVMEQEKCVDGCSYVKMISLNGKLDFHSGDWGEPGSFPENLDEKCWSLAVNVDNEDFGFEVGAWSWLQSFTDRTLVKVDTGQNLKYCVQVLESFFGALWQIIRSIFGYKDGFGL